MITMIMTNNLIIDATLILQGSLITSGALSPDLGVRIAEKTFYGIKLALRRFGNLESMLVSLPFLIKSLTNFFGFLFYFQFCNTTYTNIHKSSVLK